MRTRASWNARWLWSAWTVLGCAELAPPGPDDGARKPGNGVTAPSAGAEDPADEKGAPPATAASRIVPLFDASTPAEPAVHFDRGDALITRVGDRARDRHAREDQFQSYDHFLPHYWEHRTARFLLTDYVGKGGSTLDISLVTEWELDDPPEFRAWYYGVGSVAHYSGNYGPRLTQEGPGAFDLNHQRVGDGDQFKYTYTMTSAIALDGTTSPLSVGQFMEMEFSQFLKDPPAGRDNYYGTTFLYEMGHGGLVPWRAVGTFEDPSSQRENSHKIPELGWLGGRTTLHYPYSDEPDNPFMQMATNLSGENAQPFVLGRRVHHTDMVDGSHDESDENGIFPELVGIAGPRFIRNSCDSCHHRNGRAPVPPVGHALDQWVFKVAGSDGHAHPLLGKVLQPKAAAGTMTEGGVSVQEWVEFADGTRSPSYAFDGATPELFSARITPQLVGLGLLEAVDEATVLAWADEEDADGDGVSGKPQLSVDPVTGHTRLGRFGWKAATSSLTHQIAAALNTDMGVMTSVLLAPDCGAAQEDCGTPSEPELSDEHLAQLVKYVALLGVPARRDLDDPEALRGERLFADVGCASCHREQMLTGLHHPFAELRGQTIHPYTDLLLHDLGEGLASTLGEGEATGAEWRTAPLWGLGLSACVTGGVEGPYQRQECTPKESYLHDGRARTLEEAILWHGGEAHSARARFQALSSEDRSALFLFLRSL